MIKQWIAASQALELAGSNLALCERLGAGLIKSRARLFLKDEERLEEVLLPAQFWWAEGREALEQDWEAGDFSTWIDNSEHWQAFGVTLDLAGVLEMLPFERRAIVSRELSIVGNVDWVPAKEARRYAYEQGNINPVVAGNFVIKQARLGFLTARAVLAQGSPGKRDENDWTWQFREWDIPGWFWEDFTSEGSSSQDWETGTFAGRGIGPDGTRWVTLSAVHFHRGSLPALATAAVQPKVESDGDCSPTKPPLSQSNLDLWWDKKAAVRESLSEAELLALVRGAYPNNFISRDRIRELMGPRKRGPK
ncbi:MAG: hypothetical protein ACR2FJ_02900 [Qipengyuania sp.]